MFTSLLIANRGEIACRITRTAQRLGIRTIAVHSDADAHALHVRMADEAMPIGPAAARESYLDGAKIIAAARETGAEAIHPGYGFLAENAEFAEACAAAGIIFVGPPPSAIRAMGLKDGAKRLMERASVPVVPGWLGDVQDPGALQREAAAIGWPVLIKAVAGGGGKGMRRVDRVEDFVEALEAAQREAAAAFGDARVLLERYVSSPRHIEIQVFADSHGNVVHLFERDCSLQRRHQKVVEESPAPGMPREMREIMGRAAVEAARAVEYVGAGTVEFIVDASEGLRPDGFWFMEMNTRLQVEHPVTEAVTGVDLVEWQLRVAAGESLPLSQEQLTLAGHAIEVRLYAEDPERGFLPSTGVLHALDLGKNVRVDAGVEEGDTVTPFYDPMIAKLIAGGETREQALSNLKGALEASIVAGPRTNLGFLTRLIAHPDFAAGRFDTGFIDRRLTDLLPAGNARGAAAVGLLRLMEREQERVARRTDDQGNGKESPWNLNDGFALGPQPRVKREVLVDGERESIDVGFGPEGVSVTMIGVPPGAGSEATLVDAPEGVYVLSEGRQSFVRFPEPEQTGFETGNGGGQIRSPMHGRLVAVPVSIGQAVNRGHRVAVVEAMKMEHALFAPFDGIVTDVRLAAGVQVAEGESILTVAPAETG